MRCRISIITVCFNEEKNIKKTIDSVLAQTYSEFEYIIKDGGSTDLTNEIIESYKNNSIRLIHKVEKDNGIYDAMNVAARDATGDYLLFLNAGDILYKPNVLEKITRAMENKSADLFYGDAIIVDAVGKSLFKSNIDLVKHRMPFVHQAAFFKRLSFIERYYDTKYKICADYNLVLSMYLNQYQFFYINEIICIYDGNGISSTKFVKKRKEHEEILFFYGLNNNIKFIYHMCEAYTKQMLNLLPEEYIFWLKNWYKHRIKKYEEWNE